MRILILEDDPIDTIAIRRELDNNHELHFKRTLHEALECLQGPQEFDAIVSDLNLPDSNGVDTLAKLKSVAPSIPLIVTTGHVTKGLRKSVEAHGTQLLVDKTEGFAVIESMLHQVDLLHRTITTQRAEIMAELDRIAEEVAEKVAAEAIDRLVERLGMTDDEGVRMAIKLARSWEVTKSRFTQALATGIAGALLLALGSGVMTLLRNHGSK